MKGKRLFFSIGALFLVLGAVVFVFIQKDSLQQKFFPPKVTSQPQMKAISKDEPVVSCQPEDSACTRRNEKVVVNKLTGSSVEFAKHQCDGPRACPTPDVQSHDAALTAIRGAAKNTKLELTRITGINAAGIVYYCATGEQCWSYDTKSKKVTSVKAK